MKDYYKRLNQDIEALLGRLANVHSRRELDVANEFLQHGEYGLALEQIIDAIQDGELVVSAENIETVNAIAATMQLPARLQGA